MQRNAMCSELRTITLTETGLRERRGQRAKCSRREVGAGAGVGVGASP